MGWLIECDVGSENSVLDFIEKVTRRQVGSWEAAPPGMNSHENACHSVRHIFYLFLLGCISFMLSCYENEDLFQKINETFGWLLKASIRNTDWGA